MKKNKVIFIGSSEFAVPALESLNKQDDIQIDLVITQPDKPNRRGNKIKFLPVKQKALDLNLDIYQPDHISSKESEEFIKSLKPDLLVVASYGQLIKDNILNIPENGTINIHPSLLPKYRGATPLQSAIINGDNETGVTIMLLDTGMDSGPILSNVKEIITDNTTVEKLHDSLAQKGADLLVKTIRDYQNGILKPQIQNEKEATFTEKLNKENTRINWNQPIRVIQRFINGLDSYPTAYTVYNNKIIKLFKPTVIETVYTNQPGRIIFANDKEGLVIECQDGCLQFDEIQYPGKKRMKTQDFLRGNKLEVGYIFD